MRGYGRQARQGMGYAKRTKSNPLRICFGCGQSIRHKQIQALYCKECAYIKKDIMTRITVLLYNKNFKTKWPDYTFKVHLEIQKKHDVGDKK